MTERLRKILRGDNISPKTADEVAVKQAITNGASSGGGIEAFKVTFTLGAGSTITADKSIPDIVAAAQAGKLVYGILDATVAVNTLYLTAYGTDLCAFTTATGDVVEATGTAFAKTTVLTGTRNDSTDTWTAASSVTE